MTFHGRRLAVPRQRNADNPTRAPEPRRLGLRAHLVLLVLVVLLPALAFGAVAAWEALRRQDALVEARLLDTARALGAAVDKQVAAHIGALSVLAAAAEELDDEAMPEALLPQARATARAFGGWIILNRPDGSQALNTLAAPGTALPGPNRDSIMPRIVETGATTVSNVVRGRFSGEPNALVFVPVLDEGQVRAVLGMPLQHWQLSETLRNQMVAGGGTVALTDGAGVIAARSRGPAAVVGQPRPPRRDVLRGESGVLRGRSLVDGEPIRTAYHALSAAPGWHVWVSVPEAEFSAARRAPMISLAGGTALALAVGLGGALLVTRRVLRPVEALVARAEAVAASAVGEAEMPVVPPAAVAEFERLSHAVTAAESALRRVQRIGRVGGFEVDLRPDTRLRSFRSAEYAALHGLVSKRDNHADWVSRLHPADRQRAERHFLEAVSDESGETEYAQEYRIVLPGGEPRWIYARGEIERDAMGRALRLVGAHVDVTAVKTAEAALRVSEERLRLALEAAQLGAWQFDLPNGKLTRTARSVEIFGIGPELTSFDDPAWQMRLHPEDRETFGAAMGAVREGRQPGYRVEFRFQRPDGRWIWVESHARANGIDPLTGLPLRLIGTTLDITERKAAEERQAVLVHELDHRAKNTLAVVQAALRLTPREDADSFARAVEGRIGALARAHTLLAKGRWRGADMRAVATHALAPFVGAGPGAPVAELEGPHVALSPAAVQALSMALHELATNAAKHGALSSPSGRLMLRWELERDAMRLSWLERGGPALVSRPARRGFGSSLIAATTERQLGGEVHAVWEPEGLRWEARLPLDRLLPGAGSAAPGAPARTAQVA